MGKIFGHLSVVCGKVSRKTAFFFFFFHLSEYFRVYLVIITD